MDIPSPTCGKFPHYTFYPLFHSTFPQFPFRTLPSTFYQQHPHNDFGHDDSNNDRLTAFDPGQPG